MAATWVASRSVLAADKSDPHAGHDMGSSKTADGKMEDHSAHMHMGAKHQALIDAALHCVNKGEVCVDHCIQLLSKGDTSLKDCIRSVSGMLPMCLALA